MPASDTFGVIVSMASPRALLACVEQNRTSSEAMLLLGHYVVQQNANYGVSLDAISQVHPQYERVDSGFE